MASASHRATLELAHTSRLANPDKYGDSQAEDADAEQHKALSLGAPRFCLLARDVRNGGREHCAMRGPMPGVSETRGEVGSPASVPSSRSVGPPERVDCKGFRHWRPPTMPRSGKFCESSEKRFGGVHDKVFRKSCPRSSERGLESSGTSRSCRASSRRVPCFLQSCANVSNKYQDAGTCCFQLFRKICGTFRISWKLAPERGAQVASQGLDRDSIHSKISL